jgi:uncharacterized membrane protein
MMARGNSAAARLILATLAFDALVLAGPARFPPAVALVAGFGLVLPGLVLLRALRPRGLTTWERLVHAVGLSVGILTLGALAFNTVLPWLGIAQPLGRLALLSGLNAWCLGWGLIGRGKGDAPFLLYRPLTLNLEQLAFAGGPYGLLAISIVGAARLNAGGSNLLSLAALFGSAIYLLALAARHQVIPEGLYPWLILPLGLAVLYAYSLRDPHVAGWDINQELYVFRLADGSGRWDPGLYQNAYNYSLSITLLPTVLAVLTGLDGEQVFKLIFPVLFSVVPVVIYLTARRYLAPWQAALAAFFFASQWSFMNEYPAIDREEVALLELALLLNLVLGSSLDRRTTRWEFGVLSIALVLSHYSTSYLAVLLFSATWAGARVLPGLQRVLLRGGGRPSNPTPTPSPHPLVQRCPALRLEGRLVLLLVVATVVWNGMISPSGADLSAFVRTNVVSLPSSLRGLQDSAANLLLWKFGVSDQLYGAKLAAFVAGKQLVADAAGPGADLYPRETYAAYVARYLPPHYPPAPSPALWRLAEAGLALVTIGSFAGWAVGGVGLARATLAGRGDPEYLLLAASFVGLILTLVLLPSGSASFSPIRLYQESLLILAMLAVAGATRLAWRLRPGDGRLVIAGFLALYFLYYTTAAQALVGGAPLTADSYALANQGPYFDFYYTRQGEVRAAEWLGARASGQSRVVADQVANLRLVAFAGITDASPDALPSVIPRDAFVYLDARNWVLGQAYTQYAGQYNLTYNYPRTFLRQNKNLVYANADAAIFR